MKICFSISTYNAFEDLHISASLIKNNWKANHHLFIVACLCKPKTLSLINPDIIDYEIEIETPKTPAILTGSDNSPLAGIFSDVEATGRLLSSIIQSGKKAIEQNCDYIIYLNSGSWILDIESIFKIIEKMENRTFGVQISNRFKYLIVEDHFLFVNLRKAVSQNLYDLDIQSRVFNPVSITINGIHGMLMNWLNQVPYGDLLVYSNHDKSIDAFGNSPYAMIPLIWNPEFNLLHSNKKWSFVHFLRCKYLEKYLENKPKLVEEYINKMPSLSKDLKYYKNPLPHVREKYNINKIKRYLRLFRQVKKNYTYFASPHNFWVDFGMTGMFMPFDKNKMK